jgi:hypothetical protein
MRPKRHPEAPYVAHIDVLVPLEDDPFYVAVTFTLDVQPPFSGGHADERFTGGYSITGWKLVDSEDPVAGLEEVIEAAKASGEVFAWIDNAALHLLT